MAGPMTDADWKLSWLSAIAAGSRSAATRRGIADERAGWSIALNDAPTNATPKIARRLGAREDGEDQERGARARQAALRQDEQAPAVDRIGERARTEGEDEDRHELDSGQPCDRERRAGEDVDLERQRDPGDLGADPADDLARPQTPEVADRSRSGAVSTRSARNRRLRPGSGEVIPRAVDSTYRADRAAPGLTGRLRGYLSRSADARAACAAASRATGTRNGEHDT